MKELTKRIITEKLSTMVLNGELTDFNVEGKEITVMYLMDDRKIERFKILFPMLLDVSLEAAIRSTRKAAEESGHKFAGYRFFNEDDILANLSIMLINHEDGKFIHDFYGCLTEEIGGDLTKVVTLANGLYIPFRKNMLPEMDEVDIWDIALENFALQNEETFYRVLPGNSGIEEIKPDEIDEKDDKILILSKNHPNLSSVYMIMPFIRDILQDKLWDYHMIPTKSFILVRRGFAMSISPELEVKSGELKSKYFFKPDTYGNLTAL